MTSAATRVPSAAMTDTVNRLMRAIRSPRRAAGATVARIQLQRRLGWEPPDFAALASDVLCTGRIEGWRYRQDLLVLYLLARDVPGPGVTLEIGSYKGLATTALAYGSRHSGKEAVHTVDPHTGDRQDLEAHAGMVSSSAETFRRNIEEAGIADHVVGYTMPSAELATRWDERPIRLLFVDGWHGYDAVTADLRDFVPHLTDDGIVVVDDYLNYDEVRAAVDDARAWLPPVQTRAGRMRIASPGPLPDSVRRQLRIPWG